jgi:hypothetical protein
MVLGAVFALGVLFALLSGPQHFNWGIGEAIHNFLWGAVTLVGVVTLAGAVLEHGKIKPRWMTQWRLQDLKAFTFTSRWSDHLKSGQWKAGQWRRDRWGSNHWGSHQGKSDAWTAPAAAPPAAAAPVVLRQALPGKDHLISLVANSIFLLWWVGVIEFDGLAHFRRHGEDVLVMGAPVWTALYDVILIFVAAVIAGDLLALLWPQLVRLHAAVAAALGGVRLWLLWSIWQAGYWFTLSHGAQSVPVHASPLLLPRSAYDDIPGIDHWFARLGSGLSVTLSWVVAILAVITLVRIVQALVKIVSAE